MVIAKINANDSKAIKESLQLVERVFREFEAPDYSSQGIEEFKDFIALENFEPLVHNEKILLWCYLDKDKVTGVIAARQPCHIALLFVDKEYHRRGMARTLYTEVLEYYKEYSDHVEITVNSSPYAVDIYRRLGFVPTDTEQLVNGIRFTPMKHKFR